MTSNFFLCRSDSTICEPVKAHAGFKPGTKCPDRHFGQTIVSDWGLIIKDERQFGIENM